FSGSTPVYHYYLRDHQGNNRVVLNQSGTVEQVNHYYPFGGLFGESTNIETQPYKYNGKEFDGMYGLNLFDYGARHYDAAIGRWMNMDPLSEGYYNISPYAYVGNNPVRFIDPDGRAWRPTFDEDHDGNRTYNGYEWIPEEQSYDNNGNLLAGLYAQAIFFSDNGTFDVSSNNNIGSSTATVYLADGTTTTFDAMTNPSDPDAFATVPEGMYQAKAGTHNGSKSSYTALKMRDIDATSQTIELGTTNPAYSVGRTYATGIDIHKAGKNNYTGTFNKGENGVSQGCLLIDVNNWSNFIGNFNNNSQKSNTISVTVSRSMAIPVNANRLPAFNFFMNGTRRSFIKPLRW
ncbi:MAG: RHS repeat-associated core domain-containing protein, partial [Dysgonamonadaceae bacterium]